MKLPIETLFVFIILNTGSVKFDLIILLLDWRFSEWLIIKFKFSYSLDVKITVELSSALSNKSCISVLDWFSIYILDSAFTLANVNVVIKTNKAIMFISLNFIHSPPSFI